LAKLTLQPEQLTREDLSKAQLSGLNDLAIHEVAMVCFLFSIMDRLADAFGFDPHPAGLLNRVARLIKITGYLPVSIGHNTSETTNK